LPETQWKLISIKLRTCRELAKLIESIKDRAIFSNIEPLHLLGVRIHVVWPDGAEEPNVVIGMELGHFFLLKNIFKMLRMK
jgi:hypothetical protein